MLPTISKKLVFVSQTVSSGYLDRRGKIMMIMKDYDAVGGF